MLVLLFFTVVVGACAPGQSGAFLSDVHGDVQLLKPAEGEFKTAINNQILSDGYEILSHADGMVNVYVSNGMVLRLSALSHLVLRSLAGAATDRPVELSLEAGNLWLSLVNNPVIVNTPGGVVELDGGEVNLNVDFQTGEVAVVCLEGSCQMRSGGVSRTLDAGGRYVLVIAEGNRKTPTAIAQQIDPSPTVTQTTTLTETFVPVEDDQTAATGTHTIAPSVTVGNPGATQSSTVTSTKTSTQSGPPVTSTPTFTQAVTNTATYTSQPTNTQTNIPEATSTLTQTGTLALLPTQTPTETLPSSPTAMSTLTHTVPASSPTVTVTHTQANTVTQTLTATLVSSSTQTLTQSATNSITPTQIASVTSTPVATASSTIGATETYTATVTSTNTLNPTQTSTFTQTLPSSPTVTLTATTTQTATSTLVASSTSTATSTHTQVPSQTSTPTPTYTVTNLPSATPTNTSTATLASSPTATVTTTSTVTPTTTSTITPTATATHTLVSTQTPTYTQTITATYPSSATPTQTLTPTLPPVGQTFYVSTNGSNGGPGSLLQPWRTIQHAANNAHAGDLVLVRGGDYAETVGFDTHSGLPSAPITFRNYPNEVVILSPTDWAGMVLNGVEYVVLDGFRIQNPGLEGFFVTDANHNSILNCEVTGSGNVGIHIATYDGPASYNTVKNCFVHDNANEGIYLDVKEFNRVPVENNVIENNMIYNNGNEGIQNTNEIGVTPRPSGTIIRGNVIYNNGPDWAALDLSGDDLLVENNIVYNNQAPIGGIWYADGNNSVIQNNLVYNNQSSWFAGGGIVLIRVTNTNLFHNTVYGQSGSSGIGISLNSGLSNVVLANNIFSQNQDGQIEGNANGVSVHHNLIDGSSSHSGSNVVSGDPQFVSPAAGDFHLQAASPAIDAAVNVGVGHDLGGNARPSGIDYDIGAYEYIASP
ncbi:MAG: hypothetical protein DWQ07_02255 [Chloroflexi bacterium]|nr:MAG: hypothetical protein DWQ07_02255 [Chloroflexota bacterium]MBL1193679.1 hypothetical protein [Chloroflexota bacterium]